MIIFWKIMSFFKKTLILFGWIALIIWTFFIGENFLNGNFGDISFIDSTFAQTETGNSSTKTSQEDIQKWYKAFLDILNVAIWLLTAILTPLIMLSWWLMSPDWTSWDMFNFRWPMHNLWKIVSNIVYFVYAILLIIVAIWTIFSSKNYNYKNMLFKILIWLIMVPFTWWFVQVIISTAAAVTASVLSIPQEAIERLEITKSWTEENWYNKPIISKKIDLKQVYHEWDQEESCNENNCISIKNFFKEWGWIYGSLLIYAYWIFKIQKFKAIDTESTVDIVNNIIDLIGQWAINSIMFIVFGLLIIALTSILFVRTFWLWIYTIFSPLFTLNFALQWSNNKSLERFNIKEFVSAAFVPAVIGFILSLWIIVIASVQWAMSSINEQNNNNIDVDCKSIISDAQECRKLLTLFGNPNNFFYSGINKKEDKEKQIATTTSFWWMYISGVDIRLNWSSEKNKVWEKKEWDWRIKNYSITTMLWTIIIDFIALIFIWIAFMSGAKISSITNTVIKPFESIRAQVSEIPNSLAGWVPIPYFGNVKWVSTWLSQINQWIQQKIDQEAKESKFFQAAGWKAESKETREARIDTESSMKKIGELKTAEDVEKNKKEIINAVNSIGDFNKKSTLDVKQNHQELIKMITDLHAKAWNDEKVQEELYNLLKKEFKIDIELSQFKVSTDEFKKSLENRTWYITLPKLFWFELNKNQEEYKEKNDEKKTK